MKGEQSACRPRQRKLRIAPIPARPAPGNRDGGSARYRRLRRLGAGGMGVVHEALDLRSGQRVAIKTLPCEDPNLLYRLKREFRSLAGVRHPNLVRLHELVEDESGVFFSMDLIDGLDFSAFCAELEPGDHARLRAALGQLCAGVCALHGRGLLHRDLKPRNVLVTQDDRVVIVDFGLVSALERADSGTLSADVIGTLAYMAPEQARCGGGRAGAAADWYAVGVMLFEALTGQRPFRGSTLAIASQKQQRDPPDVFALCPRAPRDLGQLCNALLRRDPRQRADARAVARVLAVAATTPRRRRCPREGEARRAEMSMLEQDFAAVCRGERRVAVLRGPAGSGKSALARAFSRAVARSASGRRALVLHGGCNPREHLAFNAIDPLIDQLSRWWRGLAHADAMYLLPQQPELLLLAFPVLGRVREVQRAARPELADVASLDDGRARAACLELFQRLARRGPLVLIVDDAQWMDAASADLLRALLECDPAPSLMLLIVRRRSLEPAAARRLLAPLERPARVLELAKSAPSRWTGELRRVWSRAVAVRP